MMQDHHEAIISREDFDAVGLLVTQRGKEKGITKGTTKYQNRYSFSGKIICGECGATFKRRIHSASKQKYIAWCCNQHIDDISKCSMQYIREDAIETAFITMINKLIFGRTIILKPMLDALKVTSRSAGLGRINELESRLEKNLERRQVLIDGACGKGIFRASCFQSGKQRTADGSRRDEYRKRKLIPFHQWRIGKDERSQQACKICKYSRDADRL